MYPHREDQCSLLYKLKTSGPQFAAGIKHAVERGWLDLHESGTYVRLLKTEVSQLNRPYENRPIASRASDDGPFRVDGAKREGLAIAPQTDISTPG